VLAALLCVEARHRLRLPAAAGPALAALVLAIDALAWARSEWRLDTHAWVARRTRAVLAQIAKAAAAAPPGTPVVVPNVRFPGVGPVYMLALDLFPPRSAGVFIAFHAGDTVAGRSRRGRRQIAAPGTCRAVRSHDPACRRRSRRELRQGSPSPTAVSVDGDTAGRLP